MDDGFKVMVHGISKNVSRAGFSDIFLKYGDMMALYIDERNIYEGRRSGYVVYKNKRECYRAISELNDQPPFYMSLKFAAAFVDENEGNKLQVHHDDVRFQTQNDLEEKCLRKSIHLTDKSEKESSTLFQFKINFIAKCKKCGNIADQACSICGVLYCSKSCQLKDWENHTNECSQLKSVPAKSWCEKAVSNLHNKKFQNVTSDENAKQKWKGAGERIEPVEKFSTSRLPSDRMSDETKLAGERKRPSGAICRVSAGRGNSKVNVNRKERIKIKNHGGNINISKHSCDNFGKRCVDNGNELVEVKGKVDCNKIVGQVAPEKDWSFNREIELEETFKERTKITDHMQITSKVAVISGKDIDTLIDIEGVRQEKEKNTTILPECPSKSSQERITAEIINSSNCNQQSNTMVTNKSSNTSKAAKISSTNPNPWDLLSVNPDTKIVNYDLCTQQKKLSSDKFTKVTVYDCLAPDEYWVHCINDLEELKMITRLMMNKRQPSEVTYKPLVGNYCSVMLGKAVFRSKVLFVEESRAKVLFIDFGIIVDCEFNDMSDLPLVAKNYYAQAIHVKMDPWTPEEYLNLKKDSILSLKAVIVDNGLTKVQVEGVLYAQITPSPKLLSLSVSTDNVTKSETSESNANETQWPPSVLGLLKKGHRGVCTVLSIHMNADERKDEVILAIAFDDISTALESILIDFPNDCMTLPEDPTFNPKVGDLLAAYHEARELWVRSVVLATGVKRWLVACCDIGVILEVAKIRKIPTGKNYADLPSITAKCKIINSWLPRDDLFSTERIKENATLCMVVDKRKNDFLECKLGMIEGSHFCTVSLGIWAPEVDKPLTSSFSLIPEMEYVHLTSGANVKIVSYYLSSMFYVQPCDKESRQQIEDLQNSISTYAVKSEPLKEVPKVGKKYICLFSGDMKYYRVVVNRVKNSEKISVTYIDFGNDEEVLLSSLYCIPPALEKIPCFGVKIGLKKDFEKILNKDAHTFLSYLIAENAELTLIFPDGNLRSCELVMKTGSLVNDTLKSLIDPQSP